jgi:hypothetical protein
MTGRSRCWASAASCHTLVGWPVRRIRHGRWRRHREHDRCDMGGRRGCRPLPPLQPLRRYRDRPIVWGSSNFVWPWLSEAESVTTLAEFVVQPDGSMAACLVPAMIASHSQPTLTQLYAGPCYKPVCKAVAWAPSRSRASGCGTTRMAKPARRSWSCRRLGAGGDGSAVGAAVGRDDAGMGTRYAWPRRLVTHAGEYQLRTVARRMGTLMERLVDEPSVVYGHSYGGTWP